MGDSKKNKKSKNRNSDKPFDSAFKSVMKYCKEQIYHLLNETFGEHYDSSVTIELSNDEHGSDSPESKQKVITDSNFLVKDKSGNVLKRYLYECQSNPDGSMIVRMFQYATRTGFENRWVEDGVLHIRYPECAVLYLRGLGNEDEIEDSNVVVEFPDGNYTYHMKLLKLKRYTIDELFEKKLYVLVPFSAFIIENDIRKCGDDDDKVNKILDIFRDIVSRLNIAEDNGDISEYEKQEIIKLTNFVLDRITSEDSKLQEGADEFMGGKLLEFEATRIHDKAIREGRKEGVQEGAILDRIEILRDYGESDENIINNVCARFKISKEEALKYMELQKSTDPFNSEARA